MKEQVRYPLIKSVSPPLPQKEYLVVHQALSINSLADTSYKTGKEFVLPDKGTIIGLSIEVDHNSEVGNELYGLSRINAKINDDTIATLGLATRGDSTVGQAIYGHKYKFLGGLFIPVNDDDDVAIQISFTHPNASGIVYMGATAFWYIIKED